MGVGVGPDDVGFCLDDDDDDMRLMFGFLFSFSKSKSPYGFVLVWVDDATEASSACCWLESSPPLTSIRTLVIFDLI